MTGLPPPGEMLMILGMTALAGLATGIGGAITLFLRNPGGRWLTAALGFSGGVMIYISFVELLAGALAELRGIYGETRGALAALAAFFGGILLSGLIDRLIPAAENPHEVHRLNDAPRSGARRTGLFLALAIGIHNFPEGLATFAAGLYDLKLGGSVALAIALHNIPEGMSVAVPFYLAGSSRRQAFGWALLSGLAEPVGAIAGFLVLAPFLSAALLQLLFAGVAGIMVYVTFDELLPMAEKGGEHHIALYGIIGGMLAMALALVFC